MSLLGLFFIFSILKDLLKHYKWRRKKGSNKIESFKHMMKYENDSIYDLLLLGITGGNIYTTIFIYNLIK